MLCINIFGSGSLDNGVVPGACTRPSLYAFYRFPLAVVCIPARIWQEGKKRSATKAFCSKEGNVT